MSESGGQGKAIFNAHAAVEVEVAPAQQPRFGYLNRIHVEDFWDTRRRPRNGLKTQQEHPACSITMKMNLVLFVTAALAMRTMAAPANSKMDCMPSRIDSTSGKLAIGYISADHSNMIRKHYIGVQDGELRVVGDESAAQHAQLYMCNNMPDQYAVSDPASDGLLHFGHNQCLSFESDGTAGTAQCVTSLSQKDNLAQQWIQLNGPSVAHIGGNSAVNVNAASLENGKVSLHKCRERSCDFLYLS